MKNIYEQIKEDLTVTINHENPEKVGEITNVKITAYILEDIIERLEKLEELQNK